MSDGGDILHEDPGIHRLDVVDDAVEYLPDHAERGRLSYQAVVRQNQTQRQLRKY